MAHPCVPPAQSQEASINNISVQIITQTTAQPCLLTKAYLGIYLFNGIPWVLFDLLPAETNTFHLSATVGERVKPCGR